MKRDLDHEGSSSREIGNLYNVFKQLIKTKKFENNDFWKNYLWKLKDENVTFDEKEETFCSNLKMQIKLNTFKKIQEAGYCT